MKPYHLGIGALAIVLFATSTFSPRARAEREHAKQTVLAAYRMAADRAWDTDYDVDIHSAKFDLQELDQQLGPIVHAEFARESLPSPMLMHVVMRVERSSGTYEEDVALSYGYTENYSRDFASVLGISTSKAR